MYPQFRFSRWVIVAVFFCATSLASVAQTRPTTIAFVGFSARDIPASGAEILAELVREELSISPRYTVVDRGNVELLARELELQLSGLTDESTAVRVGGMLGVEKVMIGTIGELGRLYVITLKILDVETGAIERIETEEFVGVMEELRRPVRVAVQKLLDIEGIDVDRGSFVSVESEPPGVHVYIDGLFEGSAPARIEVPGPGEYHVKLYAPGYEEWHQDVDVEENATFFVNARLLESTRAEEVDERIRALQDGRTRFIIAATLYSAAFTEAALYSMNAQNTRLYFGMPLLVTPAAFFTALKTTEGAIMNKGRAFLISSSVLWGSTLGFTSGLVLAGDSREPDEFGEPGAWPADYWRPFAFASVAGGLAYGTAATILTRGDAFPSQRVWFLNLGSFMGSLVGLGVPYMFHVENRPLLFGSMLAGSTAGGGLAIYLTRHIASIGASVENR